MGSEINMLQNRVLFLSMALPLCLFYFRHCLVFEHQPRDAHNSVPTLLTDIYLCLSPPVGGAVANLFLALAVFGGKCWDRDWLMYPNYNFLSWSYYMAVFSCGFHTFAALLYGMVSPPTSFCKAPFCLLTIRVCTKALCFEL